MSLGFRPAFPVPIARFLDILSMLPGRFSFGLSCIVRSLVHVRARPRQVAVPTLHEIPPIARSSRGPPRSGHARDEFEDLLPAGLALVLDGHDPLMDPGGQRPGPQRADPGRRLRPASPRRGRWSRRWSRGRRGHRRPRRPGRRGATTGPIGRRCPGASAFGEGSETLVGGVPARGAADGAPAHAAGTSTGRRSVLASAAGAAAAGVTGTAGAAGAMGAAAAGAAARSDCDGEARPDDLASSSFNSWSSRERSWRRSSSSRMTSICSLCILPNIWTSMPMACWNWSNICCCIMLNWLTRGTSTDSPTSGWNRPRAGSIGGDELDVGGRGDDRASTRGPSAGRAWRKSDPAKADGADAARPPRPGAGRRAISPRSRRAGNPGAGSS